MTQAPPSHRDNERLRSGRLPADARLLVVGLVRNGVGKVDADVERLQRALRTFSSVQWLLIESDSEDGTLDVLRRLSATVPGFEFLSLGALAPGMAQRTARIAHCRNQYLERLENDPRYTEIDFALMADFDGINELIDEAAILSCWERSDWDVCTANQAGPYYDVWALRHPLWSPNDCKASHQFLVQSGVSHEDALAATVFSRMITVRPDRPWIEVESAFGGLAIYRREVLPGLRYQGLTDAGEEVCEHVGLHAAIRARGGRVFLNPRLICAGRTEHTRPLRLANKLARMARQLAKNALQVVMPHRFAKSLPAGKNSPGTDSGGRSASAQHGGARRGEGQSLFPTD